MSGIKTIKKPEGDNLDCDLEASYCVDAFEDSLDLVRLALKFPRASPIFRILDSRDYEVVTDPKLDASPESDIKGSDIKSYSIASKTAGVSVIIVKPESCTIRQPVTPESIEVLKTLFERAKSLTVEKASVKSTMNLIKQMSADGKVVLSFSDEVKEKFKALPEDNADRKQFFEYMEQSSHSHHHRSARL